MLVTNLSSSSNVEFINEYNLIINSYKTRNIYIYNNEIMQKGGCERT